MPGDGERLPGDRGQDRPCASRIGNGSSADGSTVERNAWKLQEAGELAYSQLENRLSRSGVKETTLNYARDFAERRGSRRSSKPGPSGRRSGRASRPKKGTRISREKSTPRI